jgi:hypothetical protein
MGVAGDNLTDFAAREELVDLGPGITELILAGRSVRHADRMAAIVDVISSRRDRFPDDPRRALGDGEVGPAGVEA